MKRTGYRSHQNGFTLAELLIVVAIIGVLVAVSIPIFSGQLEKARLATCQANRRSLLAVVRSETITSDEDEATVFAEKYDKTEYPCPDGGTFTWNDGQILCSEHDGTIIGGTPVVIDSSTVKGEYSTGTLVTSYSSDSIYKVGDDYYVFSNNWSVNASTEALKIKYTVSDSYSSWFAENIAVSYSAVKVDTSAVITDAKAYKKTGQLYQENGVLYVAKSNTYSTYAKSPGSFIVLGTTN